jgi:hypothetical protein
MKHARMPPCIRCSAYTQRGRAPSVDWPSLLIGAVVGAAVGIVGQNILFPIVQQRWRNRLLRAYYRKANAVWAKFEQLHPRLVLVQSGWDGDGCFSPGSIVLRQGSSFSLTGVARNFRSKHASEWEAEGFTNGTPIGIAGISIRRTSDEPSAELRGRAHKLEVAMHQYHYFDFLATHVLRLVGSEGERNALNALIGSYGPGQPIRCFPTPCSVGLSVFCENGTYLLLTRRAADRAAGGYWEAGKIFNCVAENAAPRDFAAANREAHESTPDVIAKRGLYEEMGFSEEDINAARLRMHSFAWASDVLDFKFFGIVETSLSRSESQERWRNAPDRSETLGMRLDAWPVGSKGDCKNLLMAIRDNVADWSPEAAFCTIRSLVVLRKISANGLSVVVSPH